MYQLNGKSTVLKSNKNNIKRQLFNNNNVSINNLNKFDQNYNDNDGHRKQLIFSEKKISTILFFITFFILLGKLYITLQPLIVEKLYWKQLIKIVMYDSKTEQSNMSFHWETGLRGVEFIWPAIYGISFTIFTWMIIYFDSSVPGVDPPMPLSPSKQQSFHRRSTTNVYFSYMMSIANGIMIFLLTHFSNKE